MIKFYLLIIKVLQIILSVFKKKDDDIKKMDVLWKSIAGVIGESNVSLIQSFFL